MAVQGAELGDLIDNDKAFDITDLDQWTKMQGKPD